MIQPISETAITPPPINPEFLPAEVEKADMETAWQEAFRVGMNFDAMSPQALIPLIQDSSGEVIKHVKQIENELKKRLSPMMSAARKWFPEYGGTRTDLDAVQEVLPGIATWTQFCEHFDLSRQRVNGWFRSERRAELTKLLPEPPKPEPPSENETEATGTISEAEETAPRPEPTKSEPTLKQVKRELFELLADCAAAEYEALIQDIAAAHNNANPDHPPMTVSVSYRKLAASVGQKRSYYADADPVEPGTFAVYERDGTLYEHGFTSLENAASCAENLRKKRPAGNFSTNDEYG
jgi:hypothetical protein